MSQILNPLRLINPDQLFSGAPAWVLAGALLDIDYVNNRAWDGAEKLPADLTAVSRASTKMTLTSSGAYTSFGTNALARTDLGLNGEEAQTNLAQFANDMTNAAWVKNNIVQTNGQTSPDGANTACQIADNAVNNVHNMASASVTYTAVTYIASVIAKVGTATRVQIIFSAAVFGSLAYANFNMGTPAVGTVGSAITASGIISIGGGYYICWCSAPGAAASGNTHALTRITADNSARAQAYVGTGTTITLWNAQICASVSAALTVPTSPIVTTGAASVTRAADNVSVAQGGWFSAAQGAWFLKARVPPKTLPGAIALAGNENKGISFGLDTGGNRLRLQVFHGSQRADTGSNAAVLAPGATFKAALSYDGVGAPTFSVNGLTVASASTPAQADFDADPLQLLASNTGTPANFWNDFVQEIAFLPTQSQAALNVMTA